MAGQDFVFVLLISNCLAGHNLAGTPKNDQARQSSIIPGTERGTNRVESPAPSSLRFGDFLLDPRAGELRKSGHRLKLQPQPFKVLFILASRPGEAVTREEIQQQVWGSETFVDFERGLNVCVQQIRAVLGDDPEAPRFIETLPKRGYRFLTPVERVESSDAATQLVKEARGANGSTATATKSRSRDSAARPNAARNVLIVFAIAAVLLLALYFGVARRWLSPRRAPGPIRSIAILPFDNYSGDAEQQYFTDGMTEALTAEMGRIHGLRVPSRTSVMLYKREKKPLQQIARELNVDALVEGSVMRSGGRVGVTVQLLDGARDQHLWGETYERDSSDVIALEHELARTIAEKLKLNLTAGDQLRLNSQSKVNPEAYAAYLHGRFYWYKRTIEDFHKSIEYYEQAIVRDPNYAPAYAGLADAYALLGSSPNDALPPNESMPKAKAAAQKALQLDDGLAEAHASLAYVSMVYDWDWSTAEKEFHRAIELNPNYATAHEWYAELLAARGRGAEAVEEMKRARDADPLLVLMHTAVAETLYYSRHYDEVIGQCRQTLELDPNYALAHFHLGRAYLAKSMYSEAIAEYRKAEASLGETPAMVMAIGYAEAQAGNPASARKALEQLKEQSRSRYVPALYSAALYTSLGDSKDGIALLEKAYREHSDYLIFLNVDPMADSLRGIPSFQALLRHIGLTK
jgi:TolB-like protein/DNA-binding winged helix-turn-helix (wHTH) protein/Flp pilus assembly protein TadD